MGRAETYSAADCVGDSTVVPAHADSGPVEAGVAEGGLPDFLELSALGARLRIDLRGVPAESVQHLRAVWHLCLISSDTAALDAGVVDAGEWFTPGATPTGHSGALMRLTQEVTRRLIAARAGTVLMLHAGALAHPVTGASVVYVAPGGTGKTTLSRKLGPALRYLTDETVAVTAASEILPYPKPLSVRREPHDGIKDECAPGSLGLHPTAVPPWVAGIVVLAREPDLKEPITELVGLLDALMMVGPETSSLALLDRPLHRLADLIESTGGLRMLRYSEAEQLLPVIHEITSRTR